ncbi:MAG: hypothetical protein ACWIPJ_07805 [Polaribacter sp.]
MASLYSIYTTKELKKKIKKQKATAILQGFVIFLMIIFGVISSVKNGISFFTFMFLFFVPMLFLMLFELKKLKKNLPKEPKNGQRKSNF